MDSLVKVALATVFALFLNEVIKMLLSYFTGLSTDVFPDMLSGFLCKFGILEGINDLIRYLIIGFSVKQWIAYIRS